MIIRVDGWNYRVPEGTAYIEFVSSHRDGHAGTAIPFDLDGKRLQLDYVKDPEPGSWIERLRGAVTCA